MFFFPNPQLVADVEKEEKDNEDQCNPRGKKVYWLTNISQDYDRYNLILNVYSTYDVTIDRAVYFCHDLLTTEKFS